MENLNMSSTSNVESLRVIVEALTTLQSADRLRVVRAALELLGESSGDVGARGDTPGKSGADPLANEINATRLSPRARAWMKQFSITQSDLESVFHQSEDGIEFISPIIPGKNKKEQTYGAYILTGVGQFLHAGDSKFDDKIARALCEKNGCYDQANHATHLKNRGNEFAGDKDKGWTLTAPGMKRGAELIKEIVKSND
jgi:hypothetical protein